MDPSLPRTDDNIRHVIDGRTMRTASAARYINVVDPNQMQQREQANCRFVQRNHRIYVQALRDLQPGTELIASDYGEDTANIIAKGGA